MISKLQKSMLVLTGIALAFGCGSKKSIKKVESAAATADAPEDASEGDQKEEVPVKPMALNFISPKSDNTIAVKSYLEIEVEITDPHPSTKWSLYYSKEKGAMTGGAAIAEDLAVDTTKITWDVTFVESGTYYLFATLRTEGSDVVFTNEQAIEVSSSYVTNKGPSARINFPVGDTVYAPGATISIAYIVTDAEGDATTAKLEYTNDGTTWTSLTDTLDLAQNNYDWTIPANAPQSARYRIRVVASDGKSTTTSYNDKVFGVTATPVSFEAGVKQALATNCASCHTGALPQGSFASDVFTSAVPAGVSERKASILERTREGAASPMPPNGTMPVAARDTIQLWMWNNGLQN
jgi:hypothetical protein